MGESLYGEPLLAEVYDLFNAWGEDNDFYLGLCSPAVGSALDLGCGTGLLAAKMAERVEVTGLDPAPAMLDIARARPGGGQVAWRLADARDFELNRRFDLIYCAGHAFQSFLAETDRRAVFRQVRRHLARGGRFAFETRNPAARAWLRIRAGARWNSASACCRNGTAWCLTAAATVSSIRAERWKRMPGCVFAVWRRCAPSWSRRG
ncbi:SAM-dependent methyltransferase [Chromobacterium vaccinii]|nr:SAM-dependent methyltransferase [Chromobacterium vaccinii]QND89341.1 SAM-dependent methyltransferase [Chromobacterium vaccinii]